MLQTKRIDLIVEAITIRIDINIKVVHGSSIASNLVSRGPDREIVRSQVS